MLYYLVVQEKMRIFVTLTRNLFLTVFTQPNTKAMLKINLYKNKRQGDENFGKVYGRSENNAPIELEGLAEHIAEHGTVYTPDVVLGVLKKLASCIKELTLSGQPVKIADLCIIRANVTSTPANNVDSFDIATNIKKVRMQFTATGKATPAKMTEDARMGYTSLAQRIKNGEVTLSNRKGEYITGGDGEQDVEP